MITPPRINRFLENVGKLYQDIYGQPRDESHHVWAAQAITELLPAGLHSVLDVGCGHGFLRDNFVAEGLEWTGVTLGADYKACTGLGLNVYEEDATFLPFNDDAFDLIFARHMLEHSPYPILTLMEWKRVAEYLILVAPAPEYWTYRGRNHYSVAPKEQLRWWLERAGWGVEKETVFHNSDPLFLQYWRQDLIKAGHLDASHADTHFPKESLAVEFRFMCRRADEVAE